MKGAEHVARMEDIRVFNILIVKHTGREHLWDLELNRRIILKWVLQKLRVLA